MIFNTTNNRYILLPLLVIISTVKYCIFYRKNYYYFRANSTFSQPKVDEYTCRYPNICSGLIDDRISER